MRHGFHRMNSFIRFVFIGSAMFVAPFALRAETTTAPAAPAAASGFSTQQLTDALKSGLGSIITQSLAQGKITVTPPSALAKVETAVAKTGNTESASGFSSALSAAVAKIAPQTSGVMQSVLKDVKMEDAQAVLSGGPDAATQYFKKHAGAALREKMLPIVKQATAASGVAEKAKAMLAAAGPLAGLGGNSAVADLDGYVCDQVLKQSFGLMAKEEAAVRANPTLLKDNPLAQKVFAMFKK